MAGVLGFLSPLGSIALRFGRTVTHPLVVTLACRALETRKTCGAETGRPNPVPL